MRHRYGITHERRGNVVLAHANLAREFYDNAEDAELMCKAMRAHPQAHLIWSKPETLKVRRIDCYDNGEATNTVFDITDEFRKTHKL